MEWRTSNEIKYDVNFMCLLRAFRVSFSVILELAVDQNSEKGTPYRLHPLKVNG